MLGLAHPPVADGADPPPLVSRGKKTTGGLVGASHPKLSQGSAGRQAGLGEATDQSGPRGIENNRNDYNWKSSIS